jgi:uncharacterized protein DUF1848
LILSCSVNADVPASCAAWFQHRLDAGYLRVAGSDPWKQRKIALERAHIDGIVFWTRDVMPFLPVLDALQRRGIAFVVQYALIEEREPPALSAVAAMRALSRRFGTRAVVWRYDPVALDARSGGGLHVRAFANLAQELEGIVDEAIVAFARPRTGRTRSTRDESKSAATNPAAASEQRRDLVRRLAEIARARAMRLSVCADAEALAPGSSPARCIDARRLADVAGRTIDAPTAGFMRDCLCARAVDIGDHGGAEPECFCGADPKRKPRLRHDAKSEFLFEPGKRFKSPRPGDLPF